MEFISAVVASLLAVIIAEGYRVLRNIIRNRSLRIALNLRTNACSIIAPICAIKNEMDLIPHMDAYALSHMMELCLRIGVEPIIIPCTRPYDSFDSNDLIVIGGPSSNNFTSSYINRFIPTFSIVRESNKRGFMIGEKFLPQAKNEEYVFLVRFSDSELDQNRSVHLLFGYSGEGTAASGYYFSKHYRSIAKKFGENSYCIAIKMIRGEGYKSVTNSILDLTDHIQSTD